MEIITRKEAKSLGKTRFFTGIPCPKGHIAEKLASLEEFELMAFNWRRLESSK